MHTEIEPEPTVGLPVAVANRPDRSEGPVPWPRRARLGRHEQP